jgi:glycine cleavage system H protein
MKVPSDLRYTEHDEWVRLEGGVATIGVTDYAQDQLGDLVHIELAKVGKALRVGDAACEVESVKAVAEVFSPVAGTIVAANADLEDAAERINEDPYENWLFKVQVAEGTSLDHLMDASTYLAKIGH